jgi:hypothetical protein
LSKNWPLNWARFDLDEHRNEKNLAGDFYFRCPKCFVIHSEMFLRCAVWVICLAAWSVWGQAQPQTFKLTDGSTISGRLVAPQDKYLQVALDTGGTTPVYTNILWARLSQETLQELLANRTAAPFARIFLDPTPEERTATTTKKITIRPPPRLDRPQGGSLFASPVMLVLLLLVYAANIYAGWEIGVYRHWPPAMTAAVAAFVPIIGPAIFLGMPTHREKVEEIVETPQVEETAPIPMHEAPAAPAQEQTAKPVAPETIVYPRGQFTFNRRFFETKFAGFLKMVPGEAERDKVIHIKSARGEFTGQRFSKVEPNEVFLQVRKGMATEDVMIPFSEIFEVQVKHKDA